MLLFADVKVEEDTVDTVIFLLLAKGVNLLLAVDADVDDADEDEDAPDEAETEVKILLDFLNETLFLDEEVIDDAVELIFS